MARNLIDIVDLSVEEIDQLIDQFQKFSEHTMGGTSSNPLLS